MDSEAGEAFDSMLHRDAKFWEEIAARKVSLRTFFFVWQFAARYAQMLVCAEVC